MSTETMQLTDIPDLSDIREEEIQPFADGWYFGEIHEERVTTDRNGNERSFTSSDTPSNNGDSRNIRLQVVLKRKADGRSMGLSYMLNYRPEDLTAETVKAIAKRQEETKSGAEWAELFRPYITLQRLSKVQQVAGVRQLQRAEDGGLVLTPLFGKTAYFRLAPDKRDERYKQVVDMRVTAPKSLQ